MLSTDERPRAPDAQEWHGTSAHKLASESKSNSSLIAVLKTVSWKKIAYVIVVAASSFLAFSLFGFRDDHVAFKQAITPERETFVPLDGYKETTRRTAQTGVQL